MSKNTNIDLSFLVEQSKLNGGTKIIFGDVAYYNGQPVSLDFDPDMENDVPKEELQENSINFFEEEEIKPVEVIAEEEEEETTEDFELDGTGDLFETFKDAKELDEVKNEVVKTEVKKVDLDDSIFEAETEEETKPEEEEDNDSDKVEYGYETAEGEEDEEDFEPTKFCFKKEMLPVDNGKKIKNISLLLNQIKGNLDNLEAASNLMLSKASNDTFISKTQLPYSVYALNSAYRADMSGLNYKEINGLRSNSLNSYEKRRKLFKTVYDKIQSMNLKTIPSFDNFLKMTAIQDLDTLLFGIYSKTHLTKSDLTLRCSNKDCNHKFKYTIANENLIQLSTRETAAELVEKLDDSSLNQMEVTKSYSLVRNTEKIIIEELGVVLTIGLPTLEKMLKTFKVILDVKEEEQEIYASALYIDEMAIPNYKALEQGKVEFFKLKDTREISNFVAALSMSEIRTFLKTLSKFIDKYKLHYAIKEAKCPQCGEVLEEIPVDIETLLFLAITR